MKDSKNQIKRGAVLSYMSILLNNIIGVLYTPIMLRMIGQSEYGLYSLALSIVSYLSLLDFGLGVSLVRYVSLYRTNGEEHKLPSLFGLTFLIYSGIGLLCLSLGIILYFTIPDIFESSMTIAEVYKIKVIILLIIINLSLSFPLSTYGAIIVAHEKFVFQKLLNIIKTLAIPTIMLPLLFLGYKSIAMTIVMVGVSLLVSLSNVLFCYKKIGVKLSFENMEYSLMKGMLLFSILLFVKTLLERLYWSTGQFVIGAKIGAVSVAIFSLAIQLKGYFDSFAQALSSMLLPKFTSIAAVNDKSLLNEYFIKIGRIQFYVLGFFLSFYILLGHEFVVLWAGSVYDKSYYLSLIIIIPYFFSLIQSAGVVFIQAYNLNSYHVVVASFTTFITLIFTFLFRNSVNILYYSAIALLIGIILSEVVLMNYIYKLKLRIDIRLFWLDIMKILVPIFLLTFVLKLFKYYLSININNIYECVLLGSIHCVLFVITVYFFCFNSSEKELLKKAMVKSNLITSN